MPREIDFTKAFGTVTHDNFTTRIKIDQSIEDLPKKAQQNIYSIVN